jgi:hypothetical protein
MPRRARADGGQATTGGSASQRPVRARQAVDSVDTSGASSRALLVVLGSLTEKQFQRTVVEGLKQRGYLVWIVPDMRKTLAGLPDVIAVHPTRVPRRVLFYELKTMRGRVRPEQTQAITALSDVYGVDARVVRPIDWPGILEELGPI